MIRTVCFILFVRRSHTFRRRLRPHTLDFYFPSRGLPRRRLLHIRQSRINTLVIIGEGKHTFPSRTRSLSPRSPMVVQPRCCVRVGRRQSCDPRLPKGGRGAFLTFCLIFYAQHLYNGKPQEKTSLENEQAQAPEAYAGQPTQKTGLVRLFSPFPKSVQPASFLSFMEFVILRNDK